MAHSNANAVEKVLVISNESKNRKTDKFLTMVEQSNLYVSLADIGQEVFPESDYEAMNATSDDIFWATKEMLNHTGDQDGHLLREQRKARKTLPIEFQTTVGASFSQRYLEEYKDSIL